MGGQIPDLPQGPGVNQLLQRQEIAVPAAIMEHR